jgi:O-antigen/teichoic acid export membrane protein
MKAGGGGPGRSEPRVYFWSQRRWWRKVGSTSVAIWGSTAFAFVGSIAAARTLGPGNYGAVVLAIATATFVSLFLDLTLTDGVVHYGFRALEGEDPGSLRSLLRAAFLSDLAIGIGIAAILIGLAGPIADLASGGELDPSLVRIAALVGLVSTVDSTTAAILLLARRADLLGWTMAVTNVTRVLLILVAVKFVDSPAVIIGAYVLGALTGALTQLVVARRVAWNKWRRGRDERSARSWVRPLVSFGIHSSLAVTFQSTEKAIVPVLLGAIAGPAAAGVFNVALLPVTVVLTALVPIRFMLLPEQAKLAAEGEVTALRKTVRGFTRIGFAIAIPGAVVGWFLLPVLIPALFSSRFEGAVEPARILLVAAVFQFAIGSWSKILPVAIGRPRLRSTMSGAYMAISVGLTALLAGGLESTGAAIATTAAAASTSIVWWFLAERVLREESVRARGREPTDSHAKADSEASLAEEVESSAIELRAPP